MIKNDTQEYTLYLYNKIIEKIRKEYVTVLPSHIFRNSDNRHPNRLLHNFLFKNPRIISSLEKFYDLKYINELLDEKRLKRKNAYLHNRVKKFKESGDDHTIPFEKELQQIYEAFIGDENQFNSNQGFEVKYSGYYFSYLKNSLNEKPFNLKLIVNYYQNSINIIGKLDSFHDCKPNKTFSGTGTLYDSVLFLPLENKEQEQVFMILNVSADLNKLKLLDLSGNISALSSSINQRPILSMEVLLLNRNEKKVNDVVNIKRLLSIHNYSYRIRRKTYENSFDQLKIHDSLKVQYLDYLVGDYYLCRFINKKKLQVSHININPYLEVTCSTGEKGNVDIKRIQMNNYIIRIKFYTNLKSREHGSTLYLDSVKATRGVQVPKMSGQIILFKLKEIIIPSPVVLYQVPDIDKKDEIIGSYLNNDFYNLIKKLINTNESKTVKDYAEKFYKRNLLS